MRQRIQYLIATFFASCLSLISAEAQTTVLDLIKQKPSYASCNYDIYPDSITTPLTPSPEG